MALSVSGGESFSLSAGQRNERNMLARLQRSHATKQLYQDLWHNRKTIEAVTAHHLGQINPSGCTVQEMDTWLIGQFNICIIIHVQDSDGRTSRKIFRCPIPHKVGEQYSPGAVDEKIRAEVATYAWIESNCPEIPIPYLHAFGLSSDLQFTHRTLGTGYVRHGSNSKFDRPYLLLEYIDSEKGNMLSDTLKDFRESDPARMQNLCRGISKIMLSLASKAQSHIGSLRFNDDGSTTLTNRPLFCANSILESEGAPRTVNRTYTTSGSFIDDMLAFREEAFSAQPNAVNSEYDCHLQMAHMLLLRLLKSRFVSEGPFLLQFTDFHASNIFVDDNWNIVALIDLEFVCALPADMMDVPYWLSVDAIDQIGAQMDAFGKMRKAFLDQFRDEEDKFNHEHNIQLASSIDKAWTTSSFWFYSCLTCINGMDYFFQEHIYKKFGFNPLLQDEKQFVEQLSSFWPSDSKRFVEQKLHDKAKYNENMARHFEARLLNTRSD